ncbi:MAG: helix-turn-helix domain-containing protein [Phycisphaerales bacterium]|nr:helix-turn-helix domain-containing protein [Phycisphaerales bacterium]
MKYSNGSQSYLDGDRSDHTKVIQRIACDRRKTYPGDKVMLSSHFVGRPFGGRRITVVMLSPTQESNLGLLDVKAVAAFCTCSTRHIHRLRDAGKMPAPVKIGALVRWRRREIMDWITAGCPAVRIVGRKGETHV